MSDTSDEKDRQRLIGQCWFLTGATASGKSSIGIELARRIDGEIISMDSMAIYRGMDIGTAKPSAEQRAAVPHYLLDVVDPTETFSVARYCDTAHQCINDILERGKQPIFVGGTPLYLKSLLRGIFDGPEADWEIRKKIEEEIADHGLEALRERLELVDPLTAHKLHPNDKRRMIRALEVFRKTGQPISHLQQEFEEPLPLEDCRVFVLGWPRNELHERIESRVAEMFDRGLVAEVQTLLSTYGTLSHTAEQAVGYREVLRYLRESGSLEETRNHVITRTRQFARRQETWFRGLEECRWIDRNKDQTAQHVADEIVAKASSGQRT